MPALRVVPTLDEFKDRHPGLVAGLETMPVKQLTLERGEEGLGHGVVVGVAAAAHRGDQAGLPEPTAVAQARELRALVGMRNRALGWSALVDRHVESVDD